MTCVLSRAPLDQICHLTVGNWEKLVGSLPDHESDVLYHAICNVPCLSQTLINPVPPSLIHPGCPLWQIIVCKPIQEYLIFLKTLHSECSKCANRSTSFDKTHDDLRKNKFNPRWDESFLTVSIEKNVASIKYILNRK